MSTVIASHNIACPVCGKQLPVLDQFGKHNFSPHFFIEERKILNICISCKVARIRPAAQETGWGSGKRVLTLCNNPECIMPATATRPEFRFVAECILHIIRYSDKQIHVYSFNCKQCGDKKEERLTLPLPLQEFTDAQSACPFCGEYSKDHKCI